MIISKKNKIVGWINIIFGILGGISYFLYTNCMAIEKKEYIYLTSEQTTTVNIMLILMVIALIHTCIINLIYIFRNWHNKKSMILNVLTIVSVITSIILTITFRTYKAIYINLLIAVFGILLLIFNKNEEAEKKHIILFAIMIINLILLTVSSIGFILVRNDYEIKYTNDEKNIIKNIMQISNGTNTNIPIKVKKNGKWGYIDTEGRTVIDFIYDDCDDFLEIEDTYNNKKYYIAPVCIGNELKIITNENKPVVSYKNTRDTMLEYSFYNIKDRLKENIEEINPNIEIKYDKYNYSDSYKENKYNSYEAPLYESILNFYVGKNSKLSYNTKTKSITYNGRKVSIDGYINIYENDEKGYSSKYDYRYLDVYQNGYIPIYNFEKEIFGWIDLNGKTYYINGKKQILDINYNYIAIKDYSIKDEANVYIADYEGNKVSDYYKEILMLENGYVVKKANDKNVYLDNNFQQITQEYDIIDSCRADDGILIVNNDIFDQKFDVININTGKVVGTDFEYISGMNDNKYENAYYNEWVEYEEIVCSLGYDFINTQLYEKYYN